MGQFTNFSFFKKGDYRPLLSIVKKNLRRYCKLPFAGSCEGKGSLNRNPLTNGRGSDSSTCFGGQRPGERRKRGRPKWRVVVVVVVVVVDWKMNEKWNLVTSVLILDEFYESSIPTGDFFFDGYTRSDAALTHRTRENLVVRFAVENLFDENYEEAIGFPATGIRARIGIKYGL